MIEATRCGISRLDMFWCMNVSARAGALRKGGPDCMIQAMEQGSLGARQCCILKDSFK